MKKVTLKHPNRTRKWGWGWSCKPDGRDAYSIEKPTRPAYTGTFNQVNKARNSDRTFNNLGGAFYSTAWFYNNKEITGIEIGGEVYSFAALFNFDLDMAGPITLVLED